MKEVSLLVLKFLIGVLLLPVVIGVTVAAHSGLAVCEPAARNALWLGLVIYVLFKFFLYDFFQVYTFGQQIVAVLFGFFKPLVATAPFVLPIYTFLILTLYALLGGIGQLEGVRLVLFGLGSFTFTMHIVLTAQDLYKKDSVPGKPTYFFAMSLVYIMDVFLMALLVSLIVPGISFPDFYKAMTANAWGIYTSVFNQLFLRGI